MNFVDYLPIPTPETFPMSPPAVLGVLTRITGRVTGMTIFSSVENQVTRKGFILYVYRPIIHDEIPTDNIVESE